MKINTTQIATNKTPGRSATASSSVAHKESVPTDTFTPGSSADSRPISLAGLAGRAVLGAALGATPLVNSATAIYSMKENPHGDGTILWSGMGMAFAQSALAISGAPTAVVFGVPAVLGAINVSRQYIVNSQRG